ncbi:MAG TPA: hypothetical protein PKY81_13040 [bacterium]|nr:hypothetical protein [bacterium]HPN31872.1 hypothetical protein [bacterium]
MRKIILLFSVLMFTVLFFGCGGVDKTAMLEAKITELEKEVQELKLKNAEYKNFIDGLYSKIESESAAQENFSIHSKDMDSLKKENIKLRQELSKYKKYVDDMYSLIEKK